MSPAPISGSGGYDPHVFFPGDSRLEGMLEWPAGAPGGGDALAEGGAVRGGVPATRDMVKGGVVVAHPYPPHGATMAQPVVYRIAKSARERGLVTLRFNFRGVEGSLGTFSGTEEYRDVEAAAAFLAGEMAALSGRAASSGAAPDRAAPDGDATPGHTLPLALAGYSFGSVMAARAAASGAVPVKALALVGFVVSWEGTPLDTFAYLATFRGPVLAVCGEHDDLGYPEDVERVLTSLGLDFSLSVVEGTGHFFEGRQREVGERVASFLAEALGAAGAD
jgi:alpha/beta superfamily hydrolase